jgi:DNA-directed RNA polymerase subunit H (RpoH/RPB5)
MSSASYQIRKNTHEISETVITNLVKMLMYRKWLDEKTDIKILVDELFKNRKEEKIYNIKLSQNLLENESYEPFEDKKDKKAWGEFNGKNIVVLMTNLKITGKSQNLNDFISKYSNFHKIIIVDSITDKMRQTMTSSKFIEVFTENELMINITEHVCCPEFTVLKNDELVELLQSYNAKRKDLLKQLDTDPMSKYLFLRRGQAVRVIRNSETTGQSIAYRIIIHKGNAGSK